MAKFIPSVVFLLLLVFLTTEVEAESPEFKPCKTASNKFKGACFSSKNCESICKTEGHTGGECEGYSSTRSAYKCFNPTSNSVTGNQAWRTWSPCSTQVNLLDILERFHTEGAKPTSPMSTTTMIKANDGSGETNATEFWKPLGSLQYVLFTRSDIACSVNRMAQYMHDLKASHRAMAEVEAVPPEFKPCKTASNKFKGTCFSSKNCESICKTEGHTGGECEGFRRRCICTLPCF